MVLFGHMSRCPAHLSKISSTRPRIHENIRIFESKSILTLLQYEAIIPAVNQGAS